MEVSLLNRLQDSGSRFRPASYGIPLDIPRALWEALVYRRQTAWEAAAQGLEVFLEGMEHMHLSGGHNKAEESLREAYFLPLHYQKVLAVLYNFRAVPHLRLPARSSQEASLRASLPEIPYRHWDQQAVFRRLLIRVHRQD